MREMTGEFNLKFDWAFNPGHKKGGCAIRIIFKWDRNILFVRNKLSRKCVEIRKSAVSALKLTYLKASRRGPDTAKVFVRLIFYWPCGQLFPPYPPTLHVKKLHPTLLVKGNCKPAIPNSCWWRREYSWSFARSGVGFYDQNNLGYFCLVGVLSLLFKVSEEILEVWEIFYFWPLKVTCC